MRRRQIKCRPELGFRGTGGTWRYTDCGVKWMFAQLRSWEFWECSGNMVGILAADEAKVLTDTQHVPITTDKIT